MKITINGQDYTGCLDALHPLTIVRKLNEPSVCRLWLSLPANNSVAAPARGQSIGVQGDDGTLHFTGYLAATPLPEFAGLGVTGPRHRLALEALSDEMLMDEALLSPSRGVAGMTASALISALTQHTGIDSLSTQGMSLNTPVSWFEAEPGASWSKSAGEVAAQARAAYRAVGGAVSLAQIPVSVHALNEADGSLDLASLTLTSGVRRTLANDVTVCGEEEPAAYVTEYFAGDGSTTAFELAAIPYAMSSAKANLVRELFDEPSLDATVWANSGPGYLSSGAGGLSMKGGNGIDGDALLTWIDPVEMGGTLLLEATGVALSAGSNGVLAGFYTGLDTIAGCVAGFQAKAQAGTGAVSLQPVVLGSATGATFAANPANLYALRIRVHCGEQERSRATYCSYGDAGAITLGGQAVDAGAKLHFQIQEYVNGVAAMPVTLYDGAVASLPGACSLIAASSVNLVGTMRGLSLTSLGSCWVTSVPVSGAPYSRRLGTTSEGSECQVGRTGKLSFYTGFAPQAGEQIVVSYRGTRRAVGRAVNPENQQALALAGLPPVMAWAGSVNSPAARSSADCRNAALALATMAASTSALWNGTYKTSRCPFATDVWPGDALQLIAPSANLNAEVVVRAVTVTYSASTPDLVRYAIQFANDWADDLAIKTSAAVLADTWLPAPVAPTLQANLTGVVVTAVNGSTVTINAGVAVPAGGGFEVRRRDDRFMAGQDADLVMRATQPNMAIARGSANDRFYIRMYDGSTPPNYSEFSAAVFLNLPLGS